MLYRFSLLASSLLATLAFTTLAQQTPAPAAPKAISIMTGPVGNAGNGAAATSVPAAPGVSSVTMGLGGGTGAGAGVGGSNLSTSVAPASPANTAGVIGNGQVAVWVVKVGGPNNELVFSPNSVTAKVGEMVQFQFYSKVSSFEIY
jgi:plastocyanin